MGFQTAFMPRPTSGGRPATPVVPIERVMTEERLHKQVVAYLRAILPVKRWLVHHSRNGGMSKGENGRAKAMGTKAGWPDLELVGSYPDGRGRTIYIELKTNKGQLSPEQKGVHAFLLANGHSVHVARSLDQVKALLDAEGVETLEERP